MNLPFPHEKNKPLSKLSTFGIGGPALYFAEAHTPSEMQEILKFANQEAIPFFILGKGSNTLFDDRGFNGLVIQNRIDTLEQKENPAIGGSPIRGHFVAGGGFSFARLGQITAKQGWTGLEFASGIPATVGGAVFMNAGASGGETKDTLTAVSFVTEKGELCYFEKKDLFFGYRTSSFQKMKGAIVEAEFHLSKAEMAKAHQKKLLDYRLKTQPYKDKSAGCAFRNPLNEKAGQLIESCGLKGFKVNGAEVSDLHANFIINNGSARAQDVLDLIQIIKEKVYKEKKILLEEEIRLVDFNGI